MQDSRWHYSQNKALTMSYLSSINSDVGLVLAGFSKDATCHVLPRGCLDIEKARFSCFDETCKEKHLAMVGERRRKGSGGKVFSL
jgi:hypothetical protein